MRFRSIALMGIVTLALSSAVFLPGIFSRLVHSSEINRYLQDPNLTFTVFSRCKLRVEDVDNCYAAYSAAVALAESKDCSISGRAAKRRFKRLIEQSKEESITEEIESDCAVKKDRPSSTERIKNLIAN